MELDRTPKHMHAEYVTRVFRGPVSGSPVFSVASRGTPWRPKWIVDCVLTLIAMLCRNMAMVVWIECFAQRSGTLGDVSKLTAVASLSTLAPACQTLLIAVLLPIEGNVHQSQPLSAATISSHSTAVSSFDKEPRVLADTGIPSDRIVHPRKATFRGCTILSSLLKSFPVRYPGPLLNSISLIKF